jgi:tetratricopeptide (TPR) repeat protein
MRHVNIYVMLLVTALSTLCVESISAQNHKERKVVREGNEAFKAGEYRQSLDLYNEALDIAPDCMEATYNRANAYHHVMRTNDGRDSTITWQQSNKYYEDMLADERLSDAQRAEVLRNVGESLMTQQEYEAALNAFRESLLLNSDDAETKYNYVLAKRIVDQMRQQNNQNQDNQQQGNQTAVLRAGLHCAGAIFVMKTVVVLDGFLHRSPQKVRYFQRNGELYP